MAGLPPSCPPFDGAWPPGAYEVDEVLTIPETSAACVQFRDDTGDAVLFTVQGDAMQYAVQRADGSRFCRPPFRRLHWDGVGRGIRMPDIGRGFALPRAGLVDVLAGLRALAQRAGIQTNIGSVVKVRSAGGPVTQLGLPSEEERNDAVRAIGALRRLGVCFIISVADTGALLRRRLTAAASVGAEVYRGEGVGEDWERAPPPPFTEWDVAAAERGRCESCVRVLSRLPHREQLRCCWLLWQLHRAGVRAVGSAGGVVGALDGSGYGVLPGESLPFAPPEMAAAVLWSDSTLRAAIMLEEAKDFSALRLAEWEAREDIRVAEEQLKHQKAVQGALAEILKEKLNFEGGTAVMLEQSYPTVERLERVLKENPGVRLVSIEGHVNPIKRKLRPGEVSPRTLSLHRADAARDQLVLRGIEPERLMTAGHGADLPVGDDEANRRVEFKVLKVEVQRRAPPEPEEAEPDPLLVAVLLALAACCVPQPRAPLDPLPPASATCPDVLGCPADRGLNETALVDPRCCLASGELWRVPPASAAPVRELSADWAAPTCPADLVRRERCDYEDSSPAGRASRRLLARDAAAAERAKRAAAQGGAPLWLRAALKTA